MVRLGTCLVATPLVVLLVNVTLQLKSQSTTHHGYRRRTLSFHMRPTLLPPSPAPLHDPMVLRSSPLRPQLLPPSPAPLRDPIVPGSSSLPSHTSTGSSIEARISSNATYHIEFWGSVVLAGPQNPQPSAAECDRACRTFEPTLEVNSGAQCNTFVWHIDPPHECWLKHQTPDALAKSANALSAARGKPPTNTKVTLSRGLWSESHRVHTEGCSAL